MQICAVDAGLNSCKGDWDFLLPTRRNQELSLRKLKLIAIRTVDINTQCLVSVLDKQFLRLLFVNIIFIELYIVGRDSYHWDVNLASDVDFNEIFFIDHLKIADKILHLAYKRLLARYFSKNCCKLPVFLVRLRKAVKINSNLIINQTVLELPENSYWFLLLWDCSLAATSIFHSRTREESGNRLVVSDCFGYSCILKYTRYHWVSY